jgi:OTU domain-containing protein 6
MVRPFFGRVRFAAHMSVAVLTWRGAGGAPPGGRDYLGLRSAAAAYMRSHPDEYAPFVVEGDAEGGEGDDGCVCRTAYDIARVADFDAAPRCSFERYCRSVEATAAWGGQLELRALAHVLRRRIVVYSAHLPTVEMGEEYRVDEDAPPLRVAYQQHAYGLGEHYNSVAPPPQAAEDDC